MTLAWRFFCNTNFPSLVLSFEADMHVGLAVFQDLNMLPNEHSMGEEPASPKTEKAISDAEGAATGVLLVAPPEKWLSRSGEAVNFQKISRISVIRSQTDSPFQSLLSGAL